MRPIALEFPKWGKWAQRIKDDVQNRLVIPRQVFREFNQTVITNAEHIGKHNGGVFCKFVQRCYVSQVAMAIRSHVKGGDDSISFLRLLREVSEIASQFTYHFFLQAFPINPSYVDWQSVTFLPFSEDGKAVSPIIVQKDIDFLKTLSAQVEDMADQSIAHLDKKGFDGLVTFGNLEACIDAFGRLVCKYHKLIAQGGYDTLEPTIPFDWKRIFTVPLDIR